jgi:excisionase family DNA binding protein
MAPAPRKRLPLAEVRALGAYIGCPKGYLRRLLFERHIPSLRVGGTKGRFMLADLDAWREAHHVEAVIRLPTGFRARQPPT